MIPYVVRVTEHGKPRAPLFRMPAKCPVCGSEIVHEEGEVAYFCVNVNCPARMRESIRYFASKNCLDIDGLGDKLVGQLVEKGLVRELGDIYKLRAEDLAALERMGEKSARNVIDEHRALTSYLARPLDQRSGNSPRGRAYRAPTGAAFSRYQEAAGGQ